MTLSVTLCLMTYNQGPFLAESLESALAQSRKPERILVADNGSTDETASLLDDFARRHGAREELRILRLPYQGGPSALINALKAELEGEVVVFQAGDDIAEPARVATLAALFEADPAVLAAHSAVTVVDPTGREIETLAFQPPANGQARHYARVQGHVLGAGLAIRRSLLDAFPPLDDGAYEDTILPFRAALLGRVAYAPQCLVRYRRHPGNVTHALHDIGTKASAMDAAARALARLTHIAGLRHADIDHLIAAAPERRGELEALHGVVDASLAEAEVSRGLLDRRLGRRLAALGQVARSGAGPRRLALAFLSATAPGLYVAFRRWRRAK